MKLAGHEVGFAGDRHAIEREGVEKFADAFSQLLDALASKRSEFAVA